MTLRFGYGTNGFTSHRLDDALAVIADLGYVGVALTLDHAHLDPFGPDVVEETQRVRRRLEALGLAVVVETGARYLLDPWRKHQPTLLHEDATARIEFLRRATRIAAELGAECVSFWSGVQPSDVDAETAWRRLREGVAAVLEQSAVRLALEPEPGHLVQHLEQALRLRTELGSPELLGITLDVGHCVAVEPKTAAECVHEAGPLLFNVQLDDMLPGVHEHLEFGEGDLDLPGTLGALAEIGYAGLAAVELPRHGHAAPEVARRSHAALTRAVPSVPSVSSANWLRDAENAVREDPARIRTLFPMVGRKAGRSPLDADGLVHGTVEDRARIRLLAALADSCEPEQLAAEVRDLYRYGDGAERRGVLRGLHLLPAPVADTGLELVDDALRANDIGLVAAALGPFATEHLDAHLWRHGVLKCLFVGVPVAAVAGLAERADDVLARMVTDYVAERQAAGRDVPPDAYLVLEEAGQ